MRPSPVRKTTLSFLWLALLIPVALLSQQADFAMAEDRPKLVLSVPENGWPPFIIISPLSTKPEGIMIDVIQEIAKAEGYDLRFAAYPEKRGPLMLREGVVDAFPKAQEWMTKPSDYQWTDPIIDSADVVVSRRDDPVRFTTPDDLEDVDVGLMFSYRYPKLEPLINRHFLTTHRAGSVYNLLRMVCHGHVDCAVVNPLVARWLIRNHQDLDLHDFTFSETVLDSAPMRFAFIKGDRWKPFIARFNAILKKMKKDGRLDEIIASYQ